MLKKLSLASWIIIGLVAGVIVGGVAPEFAKSLKPLGDVFIRMIKMIVVPLIFSSLVMGIAGTGDFKKLGRLGGKAILWFEFATSLALIVGLFAVNVMEPGVGVALTQNGASEVVNKAASAHGIDHVEMLVNIVPTNIVDAMGRGDMLQIIFFSCLFAIAAASTGKDGRQIIDLSKDLAHIMFKVTHYIMYVSPIGIFGAIAYTVGEFGLGMLLPLLKLVLCLYLALILFLVIVISIASFLTKTNLFPLLKVLKEPLVLAFSTAASEAALPIAMEKLERAGLPKHIVSFVLPLGYTFNLDGSTLYSALAVVFISQVYGIPFPLELQLLMLVTLMLSTKGIAAVPGASLIVIAGTA
ncbi:dicarboxylate/amino acid:cation symporter, partial [uncultured Veillonella sp.]